MWPHPAVKNKAETSNLGDGSDTQYEVDNPPSRSPGYLFFRKASAALQARESSMRISSTCPRSALYKPLVSWSASTTPREDTFTCFTREQTQSLTRAEEAKEHQQAKPCKRVPALDNSHMHKRQEYFRCHGSCLTWLSISNSASAVYATEARRIVCLLASKMPQTWILLRAKDTQCTEPTMHRIRQELQEDNPVVVSRSE